MKTIEDFSSLLIALGLIVDTGKKSANTENLYAFKVNDSSEIASEIILFARSRMKGTDRTVSFDMLQHLSLIFGLPIVTLIDIIRSLETSFPESLVFTDNSGIKNVQFLRDIDESEALNHY